MKNILFALDYSDNSTYALQYGIDLNKFLNANLILYHSYFVAIPATDIPVALPSDFMALEYAGDSLNKLKDKYQRLYPSMSFSTELSDGFVEAEITDIQKKVQADLLIIGSHGKTGVRDIFIGNTAQKIIRKALSPTIVVPTNYKFRLLNKIVFAANYGEDDFKNVFDLINFAKPFKSEITLLHIDNGRTNRAFDYSQLSGFMNQLKEESKYDNISIKLLEDPDVFEGLNSYLKEINADMFSISMRNRTLFSRIFEPSLSNKMIRHMVIPTMVFHTNVD